MESHGGNNGVVFWGRASTIQEPSGRSVARAKVEAHRGMTPILLYGLATHLKPGGWRRKQPKSKKKVLLLL